MNEAAINQNLKGNLKMKQVWELWIRSSQEVYSGRYVVRPPTVGVKMVILEYKREVWTGDKKLTLMIIKLEFKVLKMDAITRGGKTERAKIQGLYHGSETIG